MGGVALHWLTRKVHISVVSAACAAFVVAGVGGTDALGVVGSIEAGPRL